MHWIMTFSEKMYKLISNINAIDIKVPSTSRIVTKTQYDSDRQGLEKKIEKVDKKTPKTTGLVKNTDYNIKIKEIESKITSVTCLVTTAALNTKATEA